MDLNVLNHGAKSEQARMVSVAVGKRLVARDLAAFKPEVDDTVSLELLVACRKAAWALGARSETYEAITVKREIPIGVSQMILNPGSRKQKQKQTGLERVAQMRKERKEREKQGKRPRIITAGQVGLNFQYVFGSKGSIIRGAGHYTAGPRAKDGEALVALARAYHRQHLNEGWGGLSYEAMVADNGDILLGNPPDRKGAAVALNNTGMVNVCCPATTGDRMTDAQERSIRWLLEHWHTDAIPARHRMPRRVRAEDIDWRGHREFPSQSTACPGVMLNDYQGIF